MTEQVHVDHGCNGLVGAVQKIVTDYDGRVVDQHVDRAQFRFHLDGQRVDLVGCRHVHGVRLDHGAGHVVLDQPHRLHVVLLVHVHARQLGAQLGELYGHLASQAPAGSRDLKCDIDICITSIRCYSKSEFFVSM